MQEESMLTNIINHSMSDDPVDAVAMTEEELDLLLVELRQFSFLIKQGRVELKINGLEVMVNE